MFRNRFEEENGIEVAGQRHPVALVVKEIEGGTPEQAVWAVKELINQGGVVAIIGPHYSIDAIPAGQVAEQARIPLISPTAIHPLATAGRNYVFRAALLSGIQAQALAGFCVHELDIDNPAIFYNLANPYSRGLARTFEATVVQEGGRIEAEETYVTGEDDFSDKLARIKERHPGALFLPDFPEETESIVLQARAMGIDSVLLGTNTWDVPRFAVMEPFKGAYVTMHLSPGLLTGGAKAVFDRYHSRYGLELDDGAALTYDALAILLAAIRYAGSCDPDDIRDALYDMGPYEGVAGRIDFIGSGDPEREGVIVRFEDGASTPVQKILPVLQ